MCMYTSDPSRQYAIRYTGILGDTWYSPCRCYTREFAQQLARYHRLGHMFDTGQRAALSDVQVVHTLII